MTVYKFLFYKTHQLLYPIMAESARMMRQWIISFIISLIVFFNIVTLMGWLEINYQMGIHFPSRFYFIATLVVILLLNYWFYIHNDNYRQINIRFKESSVIKIVTAIIVIAYYFFSVRYFFYILENSPWRGNWR